MKIETSTVEIEERGVKLRLTVVDTPGYGDGMDNKDRSVFFFFGKKVCLLNKETRFFREGLLSSFKGPKSCNRYYQ